MKAQNTRQQDHAAQLRMGDSSEGTSFAAPEFALGASPLQAKAADGVWDAKSKVMNQPVAQQSAAPMQAMFMFGRNVRITQGTKTLGPGITFSWNGNAINITANLEFFGDEATQAIASQVKAGIEGVWNSSFDEGYSVSTTVNTNVRTGDNESSGHTQVYIVRNDDPSHVARHWLVGSRYMTLNLNNGTGWVTSHEFGHLLGLGDRYSENHLGQIFGQDRQSTPQAGWEGNIMAEWNGVLEKRNLMELLSMHAEQWVPYGMDAPPEPQMA